MKNTPLTEKHMALGAKMVGFAGYKMPVSYQNIRIEHQIVRQGVGVFDVSHMGEFIVEGEQAFQLLQFTTSNNIRRLKIGDAQYSCFPNHNGGIVDDVIVYRLGQSKYMLVVNAANIEKDWNWLTQHNAFGAKMTNISETLALLAVQGPKAAAALQSLTTMNLASIKYYTCQQGTFAGVKNMLVSATGYTGSGGFELYIPADKATAVWDAIFAAGKPYGIQPIGLGARDTLRLEMGYCLYGNDIDDTTSPLEAGLGWITKTKKGKFNAVDIFKRQRKEGVSKKLVGFEMQQRRIPRKDYAILDADGQKIGRVTSGTQSPSLGKCIGMGYVPINYSASSTEIYVAIRKKRIKAIVTSLPFYRK